MIIYKRIIYAIITLSLTMFSLPCHSENKQSLTHMRSLYLDAEQALRKNNRTRYWTLLKELHHYPLYPYLRYNDILIRLKTAKDNEISTFINAFSDSPLSSRLRYKWLIFLANNKKWESYLKYYKETEITTLQCLRFKALIKTGQTDDASKDINNIWLTGRSLPKSCNPVISYWGKNGLLTPTLVWKRIQLAMQAGQIRLASYLARFLPKEERHWVKLWRKIHRNPASMLKYKKLRKKNTITHNIIMHGLKRIARSDPVQAANSFSKFNKHFQFTEKDQAILVKDIALRLTYRNESVAQNWLDKINPENNDDLTRQWNIRLALLNNKWESVIRSIKQLTPKEQSNIRWQYWFARALEATGDKSKADTIYSDLAKTRSYEGFLSADKLGLPYAFEDQKLNFKKKELNELESRPGISRARELYHLGKMLDARREWYLITKSMNDKDLQIAAKLAQQWNWHDRAILTLSSSSYNDDLQLRFPIVYKDIVFKSSKKLKIEPAWIFALIRQESAFNIDARSHRNAYGLMQLLPRTARQVARSINTQLKNKSDLFKADLNIRLGISHLKTVLNRFNNPVLATAAYNAGSHRVKKWLPENGNIEADIWIETIPYYETRNYLRSILAYTAIYERQLGKTPTPLMSRMPNITPSS